MLTRNKLTTPSIGMSSVIVMSGAASRISALVLVHPPEEPYNLRPTAFRPHANQKARDALAQQSSTIRTLSPTAHNGYNAS
jgi:hypothetical protein